MRSGFNILLLAALAASLAACAGQTSVPAQPTSSPLPAATQTPSPAPTASLAPSPTPRPSLTPTAKAAQLCSPLANFDFPQLFEILKNTFTAPRPGFDDGHHGVDFSFFSYGKLTQMSGLPIHSALPGTVVAALPDRRVYGNTVIVETPLDQIPADWLTTLDLPDPLAEPIGSLALTCPEYQLPQNWTSAPRSLYLLYAHMKEFPSVKQGQSVQCGQELGVVGTTGNSVNDHLHFEVRVGPSGQRFDSMAHYDAGATEEEMRNYCTWRVSGVYQLIDPLRLLALSGAPTPTPVPTAPPEPTATP